MQKAYTLSSPSAKRYEVGDLVCIDSGGRCPGVIVEIIQRRLPKHYDNSQIRVRWQGKRSGKKETVEREYSLYFLEDVIAYYQQKHEYLREAHTEAKQFRDSVLSGNENSGP